MRLVTFRRNGGEPAIGALCDDDRSIVALAEAHARTGAGPSKWFADMLALMDGGDAALDAARTSSSVPWPGISDRSSTRARSS